MKLLSHLDSKELLEFIYEICGVALEEECVEERFDDQFEPCHREKSRRDHGVFILFAREGEFDRSNLERDRLDLEEPLEVSGCDLHFRLNGEPSDLDRIADGVESADAHSLDRFRVVFARGRRKGDRIFNADSDFADPEVVEGDGVVRAAFVVEPEQKFRSEVSDAVFFLCHFSSPQIFEKIGSSFSAPPSSLAESRTEISSIVVPKVRSKCCMNFAIRVDDCVKR